MSIANELRSTVQATNDLDQKLAKRIGQHIDQQSQALADLREATDAKLFAPRAFRSLSPAMEDQFQSLKVTELKAIATRMALPNRSKVKRKADIIQFLIIHQAPLAPSYEQLLTFWVEHSC